MKRLYFLTAILITAATMFAEDFKFGDIKYTVTGSNTVEVSDAKKTTGNFILPAEVEDKKGRKFTVTSIGKEAFKGSKITSIQLPNTVTMIGEGAFKKSQDLKKINLDAIINIDKEAFRECRSFKNIVIPPSVMSVGQYALYIGSKINRLDIIHSETALDLNPFFSINYIDTLCINRNLTTEITNMGGRNVYVGSDMNPVPYYLLKDEGLRNIYYLNKENDLEFYVNKEEEPKNYDKKREYITRTEYKKYSHNFSESDIENLTNEQNDELQKIIKELGNSNFVSVYFPGWKEPLPLNIVESCFVEKEKERQEFQAFVDKYEKELPSINKTNELFNRGEDLLKGKAYKLAYEYFKKGFDINKPKRQIKNVWKNYIIAAALGENPEKGLEIYYEYMNDYKSNPKDYFTYDNQYSDCFLSILDGNEISNALPQVYVKYDDNVYYALSPSECVLKKGTNGFIAEEVKNILGQSLKTIAILGYAYYDNHKIEKLTIPKYITYIGNNAFQKCFDLTTVEVMSPKVEFGEYAFMDDPRLTFENFHYAPYKNLRNVASIPGNSFSVPFINGFAEEFVKCHSYQQILKAEEELIELANRGNLHLVSDSPVYIILDKKLAENGNIDAMVFLCGRYPHLKNKPITEAQFYKYAKTAAGKGNAWGYYYLGVAYEFGIGVGVSRSQAHSYYAKARDKGVNCTTEWRRTR